MSFYGLKKQFNKTSQFLSEKVGGNKGSQLEEDFVDLEKKIDATERCMLDMHKKTIEYLQPNPTARAKLSFQTSIQKAKGQAKSARYPQAEQMLADVFTKGANDLNDMSPYGEALRELGVKFQEMSECKDEMENSVKQNFLDPVFELQQKDLKEISHHRKKLESRRLDYDYKKGKGAKVPAEDLQAAEEKFEESKDLCYNSMMNFIDSDTEHIGQLHVFTEAVRDYHRRCADVMDSLVDALAEKLSDAASRPREERSFMSRPKSDDVGGHSFISRPQFDDSGSNNSYDMTTTDSQAAPRLAPPSMPAPTAPPPQAPASLPTARGLYDFEPENEGELEFREGDMITLTSRIDENWLEGTCNGRAGYFPDNYVEIIVPL